MYKAQKYVKYKQFLSCSNTCAWLLIRLQIYILGISLGVFKRNINSTINCKSEMKPLFITTREENLTMITAFFPNKNQLLRLSAFLITLK